MRGWGIGARRHGAGRGAVGAGWIPSNGVLGVFILADTVRAKKVLYMHTVVTLARGGRRTPRSQAIDFFPLP